MQLNFEYQRLLVQDSWEKWKALGELKGTVESCEKCPHLVHSRKLYPYGKPTFGFGNPNSPLFFIGEAPGKYGCGTTGIPFTKDRSGEYFRRVLRDELGLTHGDIWITNVVKCCPEDNRTPHVEESENCYPYLVEELNIVQPFVIVTLGFSAARALFPRIERFGEVYAKDISVDDRTPHGSVKISHFCKVFPLWHPAFIVRDMTRDEKYRSHFRRIEAVLLETIAIAKGRKEILMEPLNSSDGAS